MLFDNITTDVELKWTFLILGIFGFIVVTVFVVWVVYKKYQHVQNRVFDISALIINLIYVATASIWFIGMFTYNQKLLFDDSNFVPLN